MTHSMEEATCNWLPPGSLRPEGEDWICVRHGDVGTIVKLIGEHATLYGDRGPLRIEVRVAELPGTGFWGVTFSPKLYPYAFCNLITWLDAPPGGEDVRDAIGWYTSPATGRRHVLFPEHSNEMGDTQIGCDAEGNRVRLYLPMLEMSPASRAVVPPKEPNLPTGGQVVEQAFLPDEGMNPGFEVTQVLDHEW